MVTTAKLAITQLVAGQASAEVTVNDATNLLDTAVFPTVVNRTTTAPPGSPTNGDAYIPAATATGDWAGDEDTIQVYYDGWLTITPQEGWQVYVEAENGIINFNGTSWVTPPMIAVSVTASTTQSQGQQPVTAEVVFVTTNNANDVITLPSAAQGQRIYVVNKSANALQVFPASGDDIDGGSTDASVTVSANTGTRYIAEDGTSWFTA